MFGVMGHFFFNSSSLLSNGIRQRKSGSHFFYISVSKTWDCEGVGNFFKRLQYFVKEKDEKLIRRCDFVFVINAPRELSRVAQLWHCLAICHIPCGTRRPCWEAQRRTQQMVRCIEVQTLLLPSCDVTSAATPPLYSHPAPELPAWLLAVPPKDEHWEPQLPGCPSFQ